MNNLFEGFLQTRKEGIIQMVLILGIGIMLSQLASRSIWRADLTEDNRYTLSEASRQIAGQITDPITVTAYFSEDIPPNLERVKSEFRNFLEEFRAYSGENLEYEFINPNENEETEREARQQRISPMLVNVRERDQMSQQRVYLGAVFRYGNQKEVLPAIRPGASLEYNIALTIKKLTTTNKPEIGLLQGHGEPSKAEMTQAMDQLEQLYTITNVTGIDTAGVPANIEALMVINPSEALTGEELLAIDQYIMSGGKAIFALNRVDANLQRGFGRPVTTGIEELLASYNIPVNTDLVRDLSSSQIQVQSRQGAFNVVNNVRYPYLPQAPNFSEHPISEGLETVVFPFVSSIDTSRADTTQKLTVLVSSSERAGTAQNFFNLNPMRDWQQADFGEANIPLGAAIEGTFQSAFAANDTLDAQLTESPQTALVVVGDGDFIVNGTGQQQRALPEDNISLFVNAVSWLADDTGLNALRTKGITNRPIKQLEDSTKTLLKYLNVLLPIVLVIGYGLFRYQRAKSRRQKWIEQGV